MIRTRPGKGTTLVEWWADDTGPASSLESLPLTMHLGGARIPIGGIASVVTEEAHRNRGYARQCMDRAVELQREEGALISFLFGIPGYYEPIGYTVVMPWYGIEVPLQQWKQLVPEPRMREVSAQDGGAMRELYEAGIGMRIGPLARDAECRVEPRKPTRWRASATTRILPGPGGSVRGYACHSEAGANEFDVLEAAARDDAAREDLLAYLGHEAFRRGEQQLRFALPPDDPFAIFLQRYDARFIVNTKPSGGGMARILDLATLAKALEAVFRHRLASVHQELIPVSLVLVSEGSEARVPLGGAAVPAKLEASPVLLVKLLFGYVDFAEALRAGAKSTLRADAPSWIFPSLHPFIYLRDRF